MSQKAGDFLYLLICQSDVVSCGIVGADDDITNYRLTVNSCAIKQRCKNVDFGGIVKKPLIVTNDINIFKPCYAVQPVSVNYVDGITANFTLIPVERADKIDEVHYR